MATASKSIRFVVPAQSSQKTEVVSQTEIAALLSLRGRLRQLTNLLEEAEQAVRVRLEAGADVEHGDHSARLEEHFRKSVAWKEIVVRLAQRLGTDGHAYCAKVLASTKPTRTVSLVLE